MRKITLLFCLCISVLSYAGYNSPLKCKQNNLLREMQKPEPFSLHHKVQNLETSIDTGIKINTPAFHLPQRNNSGFTAKLDSIINVDSDGKVIAKEYFEYDEDYYNTNHTLYSWNYTGEDWDFFKLEYEWDENKNLIRERSTIIDKYRDYWIEWHYTYNEDNTMSSNIRRSNRGEGLKYIAIYTYNGGESSIEEFLYAGTGLDDNWEYLERAVITFDEQNQMTSVAVYGWGGASGWIGLYKRIYTYDEIGNLIGIENPAWDYDEYWTNFHKSGVLYEDGKLVFEYEYLWNGLDWNGSEIYDDYCSKENKWTYNENGLVTHEELKLFIEGKWRKDNEYEYTYTQLEGDTIRCERTHYYYYNPQSWSVELGDDRIYWDTYILDYFIPDYDFINTIYDGLPHNAVVVHAYEYSKEQDGDVSDNYFIYDDKGNLLVSEQYKWIDIGVKVAGLKNVHEYDENSNLIEQIIYVGQNTAIDDWVLLIYYTFNNENNVRIKKLQHFNWGARGEGIKYNFDTVLPQLVVDFEYGSGAFEASFTNEYQILESSYYDGDAEIPVETRTFYWSSIEESLAVVNFIPADGAPCVPVDAEVKIEFSQHLNLDDTKSEVRLINMNTEEVSVIHPSSVDEFMHILPCEGVSLDYATQYKVQVSEGSIIDYEDVIEWTFTTVPESEELPMQIVGYIPAQNATDVPINAEIKIEFNQPVALLSNPMVELVGTSMDDEPVEVSLRTECNYLYLDYEGVLEYSKEYSVYIMNAVDGYVNDWGDNKMIIWNFTTETAPPPIEIVALTPANTMSNVALDGVIEIEFNQPIEITPITSYFLLINETTNTSTTLVGTADDKFLYLPYQGLESGSLYKMIVQNGSIKGFNQTVKWWFYTLKETKIDSVDTTALTVYPNPITSSVTVQGINKGTIIYLFDMIGNLLLETTETTFNINHLNSGVYVLKAGDKTMKVIKK